MAFGQATEVHVVGGAPFAATWEMLQSSNCIATSLVPRPRLNKAIVQQLLVVLVRTVSIPRLQKWVEG